MKYFYKRYKIVIITILSCVYNLLSILFAFLLMWITDAIISGALSTFTKNALIALGCLALQIGFYILLTTYKNRYVALCMSRLKMDLISGIGRFSYSFFAASSPESYQSFFLNDLRIFESQYYRQILELISCLSLLVMAVIGIGLINPFFLLLLTIIIIVAILLPFLFGKRIANLNNIYTNSIKDYLQTLSEILDGFIIIKNFNIMKHFSKKIEAKTNRAETSYANFQSNMAAVNALMAFISQILILSVFAIGGYFSVRGYITTGSIVALSQLLSYSIEPVTTIANTVTNISAVENIKGNCEQIIRYKGSKKDNIIDGVRRIELINVGLKYKGADDHALEDINLTLNYPLKYAVIGKNGAGKSSLLKLLAGLSDDYRGQILYDGKDIKEISEASFYRKVTYSPQEPYVFDMSIDDNIDMFDEIDNGLKTDLIRQFNLSQLSRMTVTSETVSGGEKAKIALIRALVRGSDCLLIDEPTAAMDEASCKAFDDTIASVRNKLCVVVTHRIDESLQKYDKIVILDKGKIWAIMDYDDICSSGIINDYYGGIVND